MIDTAYIRGLFARAGPYIAPDETGTPSIWVSRLPGDNFIVRRLSEGTTFDQITIWTIENLVDLLDEYDALRFTVSKIRDEVRDVDHAIETLRERVIHRHDEEGS
jgi:hypothetical protein